MGYAPARDGEAVMSMQRRFAIGVALVLALAACSTTPAATGPAETDDLETFAAEPTLVAGTSGPADTAGTGGANDIGNGRPTTLTLTVTGTTTGADGSYSDAGTTRACGNVLLNLTGNTHGFDYAYPFEGDHQIEDVTFDAENLLPGSSTTSFNVDVNVVASDGHRPPSIVIHPNVPNSGDTGNAQRSEAGGTTTLTVDATNDAGQTIHMTVTCGPRPT
jgi:hypothetical protein